MGDTYMKTLKTLLALFLSSTLTLQSVQASPAGTASPFKLTLPSSLGYISETYRPASAEASAGKPDFILIQDLHVNRSVQFAISGILKRLKLQGFMPDRIAVEGDTGPVDLGEMQQYPDANIRQKTADYLVQQGEMPGAMHFVVSEGQGGLFGIENDSYYQANLEMFRRSYTGRQELRQEIEKLEAVLPKLKKDKQVGVNAAILEKDVAAIRQLINNEIVPEELPDVLARASTAAEHLKQILHQENPTPNSLVESLSASINFYALALMRDEELFKNALAVRQLGRQNTTIMVTGGFHTEAIAKHLKAQGFSYAVITPNVKHHDKTDEKLYVARLLDQHLNHEQTATGADWAAQLVQPMFRSVSNLFISTALYFSTLKKRSWGDQLLHLGKGATATALIGLSAVHPFVPLQAQATAPSQSPALIPLPTLAFPVRHYTRAGTPLSITLGAKAGSSIHFNEMDFAALKEILDAVPEPHLTPFKQIRLAHYPEDAPAPNSRADFRRFEWDGNGDLVVYVSDDRQRTNPESFYLRSEIGRIVFNAALSDIERQAWASIGGNFAEAYGEWVYLKENELISSALYVAALQDRSRNTENTRALRQTLYMLGLFLNPTTHRLGLRNGETTEVTLTPKALILQSGLSFELDAQGRIISARLSPEAQQKLDPSSQFNELLFDPPIPLPDNLVTKLNTSQPLAQNLSHSDPSKTGRPRKDLSELSGPPRNLPFLLRASAQTSYGQARLSSSDALEQSRRMAVNFSEPVPGGEGLSSVVITPVEGPSMRLEGAIAIRVLLPHQLAGFAAFARMVLPEAKSNRVMASIDSRGQAVFPLSAFMDGDALRRVPNLPHAWTPSSHLTGSEVLSAPKIILELPESNTLQKPFGMEAIYPASPLLPHEPKRINRVQPQQLSGVARLIKLFNPFTEVSGQELPAEPQQVVPEVLPQRIPLDPTKEPAQKSATFSGPFKILTLVLDLKDVARPMTVTISDGSAQTFLRLTASGGELGRTFEGPLLNSLPRIQREGGKISLSFTRLTGLNTQGALTVQVKGGLRTLKKNGKSIRVSIPYDAELVIQPPAPNGDLPADETVSEPTSRPGFLDQQGSIVFNATNVLAGLSLGAIFIPTLGPLWTGTLALAVAALLAVYLGTLFGLTWGYRVWSNRIKHMPQQRLFAALTALLVGALAIAGWVGYKDLSSLANPAPIYNVPRTVATSLSYQIRPIAQQGAPFLPSHINTLSGETGVRRSELISSTILDREFFATGLPTHVTTVIQPEKSSEFDHFWIRLTRLNGSHMLMVYYTRDDKGIWSDQLFLDERRNAIRDKLLLGVRDGNIYISLDTSTLDRNGVKQEIISGVSTPFKTTTVSENRNNSRGASLANEPRVLRAGLVPFSDSAHSFTLFLMAAILGFFTRKKQQNAIYIKLRSQLARMDLRQSNHAVASLFTTPYQIISDRLTQQALQDRLRKMREAAARARQLAVAA